MEKEIENAFCVVRNEFLNNNPMHNALTASIESAIREMPPNIDRECAARRIADRIIGREE